ncbi:MULTISPECIES: hypothetical protein [Pseudoalteromonas]|uniref:hypothetical protein n=1 Tax=Pseudoalteromonas TaxID=53246 RepID=UPI0002CB27E7|nr:MULTISPECIES: hypothetical protein [Pseudoalteromonas]ENO00081.1 hypothetical protein J139_02815 [Pseudoalteromonas agarivorans S816]MDI3246215.1 hypothetical protein [Pseudoalteromonas agarivorans]TMS65452.1 hypothetical protein CWB83_13165 [Pseudoalteromonas sp. S1691]TMS68461.1 hypothetical protein CWB86_12410 [Pseudoalteromonas sp. S1731]TMS75293.1 hypothetical protein CWB88_02475 [Pseudoalteromonas sp. S1941]
MKYILLIFILFSSAALASDPQQNTYNTHKTHSYVGFHGMALILAGDKLLASHMPLYALPHNYQIVYEVTTNDTHFKIIKNALNESLKKQTQITILPTKFDLNLLINKLTPTLNTTVFNGHFERGGTALFSTKLTFKNPLYVKKIAITQPEKEEFDLIKVSAEQGVIIHKIQSRPSYDSLSLVALTNGKYNGQLKCDAPVTTTLASKLKACFKSVPSYLETHDFAVN